MSARGKIIARSLTAIVIFGCTISDYALALCTETNVTHRFADSMKEAVLTRDTIITIDLFSVRPIERVDVWVNAELATPPISTLEPISDDAKFHQYTLRKFNVSHTPIEQFLRAQQLRFRKRLRIIRPAFAYEIHLI